MIRFPRLGFICCRFAESIRLNACRYVQISHSMQFLWFFSSSFVVVSFVVRAVFRSLSWIVCCPWSWFSRHRFNTVTNQYAKMTSHRLGFIYCLFLLIFSDVFFSLFHFNLSISRFHYNFLLVDPTKPFLPIHKTTHNNCRISKRVLFTWQIVIVLLVI